MINKLLITCLQRNKRLILPTLGAFIRKNIDGVGVVLVFVPFLNKDDGVLHSAIKSWAGVEDEEANQILTEYISFIKKSLDERGKYCIEGIGVLKYDINKIVSLAKEDEIIEEKTKAEPKVEPKSEPTMDDKQPEATTAQPVAPVTTPAQPTEQPATAPIATPAAEPAVEVQPTPEPVHTEPTYSEPVAPAVETQPIAVQPTAIQQPSQPAPIEPAANNNQPVDLVNRLFREQPSQPNQGFYKKPTDMGARYFSPDRDTQSNSSSSTTTAQQPAQTEQANQIHNRADVSSAFNQPQQQQQQQSNNISDIYKSKSSKPSVQQSPESRPSNVNKIKKQIIKSSSKNNKKKKNNDIVLIVAIAAIVLTIGVLIYGYLHGGEQTLDNIDMYDVESVDAAAIDNTNM